MSDASQRDANVRLSADIDPYQRQLQMAAQDTDKLSASVDKLAAKLDGLTKRAGKKLVLFGAGATAGEIGLAKQAADFEKQLSTLNATAAVTDRNLGNVRKQVRDLTKEFPVSRGEVVALVTTLDKLGVNGSKNLRLVAESASKLSLSTGEDLGSLATGLVELQKQTGTLNAGTMDRFANTVLQTSKNAGVAATGVLQFSQAIAPAARAAQMGEAEIVGVSAAFQKAGQDGYAAATTFSQVLNDITRQVATGSPELAKYANLIGVTTDQFKEMDRGQAVAAIFDAINKQGPDAIKTLDRLGYDGVRALKSIQAVSQSGGLNKAINDALGAYQSTGALEAGSGAATKGLSDELIKTKNTLQDISTEAGQPALWFFTKLAEALNNVLTPIEPIAAGLAKITGALGGGLALTTLGLGGAMMAAKTMTTVAAVAGFARGPGLYAKEGYQVGRAMTRGEDLMGIEGARRYTDGSMRWHQRIPYLFGQGLGLMGGEGGGPGLRGMVGSALAAPLTVGKFFTNTQRELYVQAGMRGYDRPAPIAGNLGNLARALVHDPRGFAAGLRTGGATEEVKKAGMARDPEEFGKALRDGTSKLFERSKAETQAMGVTRRLTRESALLAGYYVRLQATAVATTAKLGLMGGASLARRGAVGALGLLGGGNPYLGGAVALGMGGAWLYSQNKSQGKVEFGDSAPIDKYNAALGIATTELGSFADAVRQASHSLPRPQSFGDVSTVSQDVVNLGRMPKRKMTNDLFDNLKYADSRAAMLQLMGITDPRQLQLVQADLVQARGRQQAQRATDIYLARRNNNQGVDYQALVRDIQGEQGQGFKGKLGYADPTGAKMVGAVYESLRSRSVNDAKNFNADYAGQRELNEVRRFLGAALPTISEIGQGGNTSKKARAATQAVQGFEEAFGTGKLGFDAVKFGKATQGMTDQEQADYFFKRYIRGNRKASQIFEGLDLGGTSTAELARLRTSKDSPYVAAIKGIGQFGNATLNNGLVQKAVNEPGNANAQYAGIGSLLESARAAGETLSGTDQQLQRLKTAIGDTTDPLYQLAGAAQQLNQAQRAAAMGYQSRTGQLGSSVENYRGAMATSGPDQGERRQAARQELEAQKKSYYDYMVSIVQAQKNYSIQMERAEEDRNTQIARSNRDFYISMEQAAEDFYRSRARQERDFGISQARAQTDFHLSMRRGAQDFALQMKRQAEDAAKSMYDPFTRVPAKWTTSLGSLMQNLREQNQRMAEQQQNLRSLRAKGLHQDVIDQLDLANPANSQQLQRIMHDIDQSKGAVGRLNRQVDTRKDRAGDLVNSRFNEQFRRQQEDYQRGVDRATADFEKATKRAAADFSRGMSDSASDFAIGVQRAKDAHGRALADMADDWHKQVDRSQEDLARMSEQVFGSFEDVMQRAIELVTKNLGTAGDKVVAELKKVRKKFPELFADLYADMDSSGGSTPLSPRTLERLGGKNPGMVDTSKFLPATKVTAKGGATNVDNSTNVSGNFTVVSKDPDKVAQELAKQSRVKKLTRPGGMGY